MTKFLFEPKYVTEDGIFEVEVDMESLVYETTKYAQKWITAKDVTNNTVRVFNTETNCVSDKNCYLNSKGLYFKGWGKRYFLKDLKPLN